MVSNHIKWIPKSCIWLPLLNFCDSCMRYSAVSILHIILFIRIREQQSFPFNKLSLNNRWIFKFSLIKRRKYYLLCILVALPLPAAFVTNLYTSILSGSVKSTHLMYSVQCRKNCKIYYMLDRCQTSQLNSIYSMFSWNLQRASVNIYAVLVKPLTNGRRR